MTNNYTGACECEGEQSIIEVYDEELTDEALAQGHVMATCKCKCSICNNVYLTELRLDTPIDDEEDWMKDE